MGSIETMNLSFGVVTQNKINLEHGRCGNADRIKLQFYAIKKKEWLINYSCTW